MTLSPLYVNTVYMYLHLSHAFHCLVVRHCMSYITVTHIIVSLSDTFILHHRNTLSLSHCQTLTSYATVMCFILLLSDTIIMSYIINNNGYHFLTVQHHLRSFGCTFSGWISVKGEFDQVMVIRPFQNIVTKVRASESCHFGTAL